MTCALRCTSVNAATKMADGDTVQTTPVIKDAPITYKSDVWANFGFYELDGGLHGGVVVSTIASQRVGSRFDPHLGPFCVKFACSPRVCVGSLRVLWLPPTVQKHAC